MKTLNILSIILLLGLNACKTGPTGQQEPDIARIARTVEEVAAVGTEEALRRRPDLAPQFELADAELKRLEEAPTISLEALRRIVAGLPVKELRSENARLSLQGARLLIAIAGWSEVEIVRTEQLRPVVSALRFGLATGRGLAFIHVDPNPPTTLK